MRALPVLTAVALLATFVRPTSAAAPDGTVLLTLATQPGTGAALHRLASHPNRAAARALTPSASHTDAVAHWARAHGLLSRSDGWTTTLSGPADTLAALFGTTLSHGRATTDLHVPAALHADVTAAHGLAPLPRMRPHAVPFGLTSATTRLQYGVTQAGATGAGVTVGTLNLTGWNSADLSTYSTAAGLPITPGQVTTVPVDNPTLTPDGSGDDLEVAMDAEAILAAAPAAKQRMYFAPNDGWGTIHVLSQMASDGQAGLLQVASTSWGLCEPNSPSWYRDAVTQQVDRMLAAGVTLFAAAGDDAMYDCRTTTAAVDFPASYPGVVAVGGTRLGSLSTLPTLETAWPSGGGGVSVDYPRPSWQSGTGGRLVPDVASVADPGTGMGIYNAGYGGWVLGGGTSLGAPTWAGLTAAALSAVGRTTGLGDIHLLLYAHPEAFRDITAGSNGFAAGPGYDEATGLGAANWDLLGPLLTGSTPPADTLAPTTTVTAALASPTTSSGRFAWAGHDPAPSSGIAGYVVSVAPLGGSAIWTTTTTATSVTLGLTPGRSYVLKAQSRDVAGHLGLMTSATLAVPYDDSAFGRVGTWARPVLAADYRGLHLVSSVAGSAATLTFTGRSVTLGVLKTPSAGYLDVYVDGRRTARLDLWSSVTEVRQGVRLGTWVTSARHTVRVVVVGTHRAGSAGSNVYVDSLTVTP